jgi:hypothetical protein
VLHRLLIVQAPLRTKLDWFFFVVVGIVVRFRRRCYVEHLCIEGGLAA